MRTNRSIGKLRDDIKHNLQQLKLGVLQQELEKQYDQPACKNHGFERRLAEALHKDSEMSRELT